MSIPILWDISKHFLMGKDQTFDIYWFLPTLLTHGSAPFYIAMHDLVLTCMQCQTSELDDIDYDKIDQQKALQDHEKALANAKSITHVVHQALT